MEESHGDREERARREVAEDVLGNGIHLVVDGVVGNVDGAGVGGGRSGAADGAGEHEAPGHDGDKNNEVLVHGAGLALHGEELGGHRGVEGEEVAEANVPLLDEGREARIRSDERGSVGRRAVGRGIVDVIAVGGPDGDDEANGEERREELSRVETESLGHFYLVPRWTDASRRASFSETEAKRIQR